MSQVWRTLLLLDVSVRGWQDSREARQRPLEQLLGVRMKDDRSVDYDHASDSVRIIRSEVNGEQCAEGVPAHDHLVEPEMVDQCDDILCMLLHRVASAWLAAAAAAAQIGSNYAMSVGEALIEKAAKLVRVRGQPVKQDDCRLGTIVVQIMNDEPAHRREAVMLRAIIDKTARLGRHVSTSERGPACISRRTRFNVLPAVLLGKSSEIITCCTC